jgi:hypothetical protein
MSLTTTASDLANFAEVSYTPGTIKSLALQDNPLSAFFPRKSSGGLNITTRLLLEEAGGVGATLAAATTAEVDPAAKVVIQSWKKFYTSWSMDNDSIEQSEKNAIIPAFRLMYESTLRKHGDQLETALWGSQTGSLTQIPTGGVTSNTFTCGNPEDVFKFAVGDILVVDDTAAGTSLRSGTMTVASVQYEAATVTVGTIVSGTAAADYVFKSSFQNAGTMSLLDWLPNSVHATTDAFGTGSLDRYPWGARASGWRYTASAGMSNREAIIKGLAWGKNFGGRAKVLWGSPARVAALVVEMQNTVVYDGMNSGELKLNFQGVRLTGPQGPILVMEAPKAPGDRFFALERESWELHTIGELIRNPVRNGKFIDSETEDGIRGRHKTTFGLSCHLPGHNGQIIFA